MLRLVRLLSTSPQAISIRVNRPTLVDPIEIQNKINKLAYFVERTKLGKSLPVYTDIRHNGQKVLQGDLKKILPKKALVTVRQDLSQIIIKGNHEFLLRKFLTEKGF